MWRESGRQVSRLHIGVKWTSILLAAERSVRRAESLPVPRDRGHDGGGEHTGFTPGLGDQVSSLLFTRNF